jgi:hypothetical protein
LQTARTEVELKFSESAMSVSVAVVSVSGTDVKGQVDDNGDHDHRYHC